MAIAALIASVTFAAFCVWLGVRVYNRRERWAKWTAAGLVVLLIAYPLSVGVAFRLLTLAGDPGWAVDAYHSFYAPIWWLYDNGPEPVRSAIRWYCRS
jgi:hypothetical protein